MAFTFFRSPGTVHLCGCFISSDHCTPAKQGIQYILNVPCVFLPPCFSSHCPFHLTSAPSAPLTLLHIPRSVQGILSGISSMTYPLPASPRSRAGSVSSSSVFPQNPSVCFALIVSPHILVARVARLLLKGSLSSGLLLLQALLPSPTPRALARARCIAYSKRTKLNVIVLVSSS